MTRFVLIVSHCVTENWLARFVQQIEPTGRKWGTADYSSNEAVVHSNRHLAQEVTKKRMAGKHRKGGNGRIEKSTKLYGPLDEVSRLSTRGQNRGLLNEFWKPLYYVL